MTATPSERADVLALKAEILWINSMIRVKRGVRYERERDELVEQLDAAHERLAAILPESEYLAFRMGR